ncbi:intradiol ring-cleavage dioxygenase [Bradyrhizobium sp. CSA112]|uniref:dioxygenase family protein n=1 Tax=Bradyrhizobium sp. CSA112 TaxID=2699170 RepID=UPI0023B18B0E|nr:intradiol ring-cleavage dioxygenase [Bradyrhizobium sp. CSA112]MDE5453370.1 intradiol ring-cleavage dioxygenase [Bradyrhizobium sp. CSA112]
MMTVTTEGECPMIDTPTRRVVLGAGVFAAGSLLMVDGSMAQAPLAPTPECHDGEAATLPQTEGPFFKPSSPERIELLEEGMAGQPIELVGFVLTRACKPIAGALLDFWQADDKGRYDNSGFRLRGHQFADAEGRYRLRSIVPGAYVGRTRHIHVKVQPGGGRVLTTQLYFPGEALNRTDGLFRKELLVRTAKNAGWLAGRFDFVLG